MITVAPETEQDDTLKAVPTRFVYASGDSPLDGYTIRRGVGSGGFGEVYYAESDAGKQVALKLVRRNLDVELRGVRHCLNLKHPNLIGLYDIRTDDHGDTWIVMEYVAGARGPSGDASLEDVIARHPDGMPTDEAMWWMHGIAAGVAHLHDNGVVHRDLKPGNIFLDGGTIKIGDYGLSKFISCSRRSGQTESIGTVHYMAPEIANGRYGREIDTYALGVILYEMLTGHVPFEGESVGEVLMKHLTAEPDLSKLEEPYREIVARLLAKDPESRVGSVAELIDLLPHGSRVGDDRAVKAPRAASSPTAARKVSMPSLAQRPEPRNTNPLDIHEPIFAAVSGAYRQAWSAITQADIAVKVILAILAVVTISQIGGDLIEFAFAVFVLYLCYWPIWWLVIRPGQRKHALRKHERSRQSEPDRVDTRTDYYPRRGRKFNWRLAAEEEAAAKPLRGRATELLGSMLVAALICAGAAFMPMGLMADLSDTPLLENWLWIAVVSTLGSWSVLAVNKATEGRREDQVPVRGALLVCGALVGVIGGAMAAGMDMNLPADQAFGPGPRDTFAHGVFRFPYGSQAPNRFDSDAPVSIAGAAAYFGLLMLSLRWWRQAEWIRERRLSIWSLFVVVLAAWLVHLVVWFPQPTGIAVAAITAAAVQLSSPWLPPSRREELARNVRV